jgi:hypothetical protein
MAAMGSSSPRVLHRAGHGDRGPGPRHHGAGAFARRALARAASIVHHGRCLLIGAPR